MRHTLKYTYRSVNGMIDVEETEELDPGVRKSTRIKDILNVYKHSKTPLVKMDGKKIDISDFLSVELVSLSKELYRITNLRDRISREMMRRRTEE